MEKMPTDEKKDVDLSELRETLGTIMGSFTYIYDPYAMIKEIDIIMSFESAMLDFKQRWKKKTWGDRGILVDLPQPRKKIDIVTGTAIRKYQEKETQTARVYTYEQLFKIFRAWWESAVDAWNSQTGNWKKSIIICSRLRSDLMRIALKEQLVSLSGHMYSLSVREPLPQPQRDNEFFAEQ